MRCRNTLLALCGLRVLCDLQTTLSVSKHLSFWMISFYIILYVLSNFQ